MSTSNGSGWLSGMYEYIMDSIRMHKRTINYVCIHILYMLYHVDYMYYIKIRVYIIIYTACMYGIKKYIHIYM